MGPIAAEMREKDQLETDPALHPRRQHTQLRVSWDRGWTFFTSKDGKSSRSQSSKLEGVAGIMQSSHLFSISGNLRPRTGSGFLRSERELVGTPLQVCEREHDRNPDFQIGVPSWDVNLSV